MTKKEQNRLCALNGGRGGQAYRRLFEYYENKVANLENKNAELEALVEKLKCCQNCYHHRFWGNDLGCNLDYDSEFECLETKSKWRLWEK